MIGLNKTITWQLAQENLNCSSKLLINIGTLLCNIVKLHAKKKNIQFDCKLQY